MANSRGHRNGNFSHEDANLICVRGNLSERNEVTHAKKGAVTCILARQRIVAAGHIGHVTPKQMAAVTTDNLAVNP